MCVNQHHFALFACFASWMIINMFFFTDFRAIDLSDSDAVTVSSILIKNKFLQDLV